MKRKVIIGLIVLLIVIIGVVGFSLLRKNLPAEQGSATANQQDGTPQTGTTTASNDNAPTTPDPKPPAKRSDTELLDAITTQEPSLIEDSRPVFTIVSTKKTTNAWYVVTIKHKDPSVGIAKIIMKDNGGNGGLVVIAGPGTSFSPDVIYLPDEVRALL